MNRQSTAAYAAKNVGPSAPEYGAQHVCCAECGGFETVDAAKTAAQMAANAGVNFRQADGLKLVKSQDSEIDEDATIAARSVTEWAQLINNCDEAGWVTSASVSGDPERLFAARVRAVVNNSDTVSWVRAGVTRYRWTSAAGDSIIGTNLRRLEGQAKPVDGVMVSESNFLEMK